MTVNAAFRETAAQSVLYASYVSPFPTNSGERIRALNLIRALRFLGYRVEAMVGNYDNSDLRAQNDPGVHFRQIPFAWPRLRQEASLYIRPHAGFVEQVRALHREYRFSAILLDYGFMGAQIAPLRNLGIPIILGTHNWESALTGSVPAKGFAGRAAIALRQGIEAAHERHFFKRADAVLCVSEADLKSYSAFVPKDRLHLVPNFTDIPDIYGSVRRLSRIVMTGSFDNFQNRDGLRWFLDAVWDDRLHRAAEFCIAGKHSETVLREFAKGPGVIALGPMDDLIAEIAKSSCAIVPILQGGGTRFKCLEAMAARTPVVSTSKGCEGIAHAGAFKIADTPEEFRQAILGILTDENAARRSAAEARAVFDREYGLAANAARLMGAITAATRAAHARLSG